MWQFWIDSSAIIAGNRDNWIVTWNHDTNNLKYVIKVPSDFTVSFDKISDRLLRQIIYTYGPLKSLKAGHIGPIGEAKIIFVNAERAACEYFTTVPLCQTSFDRQIKEQDECERKWLADLARQQGLSLNCRGKRVSYFKRNFESTSRPISAICDKCSHTANPNQGQTLELNENLACPNRKDRAALREVHQPSLLQSSTFFRGKIRNLVCLFCHSNVVCFPRCNYTSPESKD